MSNEPTRKEFFAKLLGVIAAVSLLPKLFGKSSSTPVAAPSAAKPAEIQVRPAPRTVARTDSL